MGACRKRILHIHSGMVGGGIETFIQSTSAALQLECEFSLFTIGANAIYYGADIPTSEEIKQIQPPLRTLLRLVRHIGDWQPDIVHMHYGDAALLGTMAVRLARSRARRIIHLHSGVPAQSRTRLGHFLQRHCLQSADAILACSEYIASVQAKQYAIPEENIAILYNPVTVYDFRLPIYPDDDHRRPLRADAGPDETVILFLGRLTIDVKGLDVLCEAVQLMDDHLRFRVVLTGPGNHAQLREQLRLSDRIILRNACQRHEVPALLQDCDIYVQPSRWEGLGISILEAMAAGRPVVASRVGGIPEIVENGVTGLLVPSENPSALARALEWMIRHPQEREVMGRRGRKIVTERFDMPIIAEQLRRIYRGLLATGCQAEGCR